MTEMPETAKAALEMWDNGIPVATLEMGGIGPSDEQIIHIATFELIRQFIDKSFSYNTEEAFPILDTTLRKIAREKSFQISAAQYTAVKSLTFHYLTFGYANTIKTYGNKKIITVCRKFPVEVNA